MRRGRRCEPAQVTEAVVQRGDGLFLKRQRRISPPACATETACAMRHCAATSPPHMNSPRYRLNKMWLKSGFSALICVAIAPPSRAIINIAPRVLVRGIRYRMRHVSSITPIINA
ncbi:hypothetical protein SCH4B_0047 [Ruegeria sp. TrichCH4B]|nr:hypothetical protein SCH4B_0047 [Ruegeria sp. TrichCH4B]